MDTITQPALFSHIDLPVIIAVVIAVGFVVMNTILSKKTVKH